MRVLKNSDMHRFAAHVRQSMLSCRRTQPTAQDFLQALHKHQLSLKALLPHLEPPVPRRRARIVLPYEPVEEEEQYDHHFIGVTLDDTPTKQDLSSMPSHLPPLPSKHTYKATAEYPEREEDPRKIRERATEEGRLGEEALRRLVSAKLTDRLSSSRAGHGVKSMRTKRDELWKGAMDATSAQNLSEHPQHDESMQLDVSQHAAGLSKQLGFNHGRVSSAVNADKKFWRKPAPAQGSSQSNSRGVT